MLNISTNPALIFTSLSQCVTAFQTSLTAIQDDRGFRWSIGCTGWSMFNTVQVPNDTKYPIGGCRDGGTPAQFPNDGFSYGASMLTPGERMSCSVTGRSIRQEHHQLPDLVGPGPGTGEATSADAY